MSVLQSEKLQKVLANLGYGSRREIEAKIQQGRISIDGKLAKLGDRVSLNEGIKIRIDGTIVQLIHAKQKHCRVLAYYKPEGEICTRQDPENRLTVFQRLPLLRDARWVAIGRLDINTSGLLLFTTDGELANRLMHPKQQIEREYAVRILGEVTDDMLRQLTKGIMLEDGMAKFKKITFEGGSGSNHWYRVTLTEGRNREVRRLWQAVGVEVSRLLRVRYGNIPLPKQLPRGAWIELPLEQINYLRSLVELPLETVGKLNSDKERIKTSKIRRVVRERLQKR